MADGEDPTLDVQINVRANTAGAEEAKRVLRDVGQEARKSGEEAFRASTQHGSAFGRIVTGSRNLSAAMRGVTAVMQGGIFTIGGFAQALNALINVVRAGVVSSGPWALLALGLGTIIGLFRGLMTAANKAGREMREGAKGVDEFKTRLRELTEENKTALEEMKRDVDAVKTAYDWLNGAMDTAAQRIKAIHAAEKDLAIAQLGQQESRAMEGATTPEQREAIAARFAGLRSTTEARFSSAGLIGENLNAGIRASAAQKQIRDLAALREAAQRDAQSAQQDADAKADAARKAYRRFLDENVTPGGGLNVEVSRLMGVPTGLALTQKESPEMLRAAAEASQLAQPAILARIRAQQAQKRFEEISGHTGQGIDAAARDFQAAQTAQQVTGIQGRTAVISFEEERRAMERSLRDKQGALQTQGSARAQQVNAEIESLRAKIGFTGSSLDPAMAEMSARLNELTKVAERIPTDTANAVNAMTDAYQKNIRELKKVQQQLQSTRAFTTGQ